jgi:DNA mismatch repair protein MutS
MTETAHILRSATSSSLVIMDEVGRGTSTEDGLSIAHAVTEFLLDHIGSRTLFATHYHELSRINHPRLANWCLDVMESAGTIVFLKKVRPGASANSYGLHVAQLAGIPEAVLVRARELLADFAVTHPEAASGTAFPLASPDIPAKAAMPIAVSGANANADPSRPQPSPRPQLPQLFSEEELVLEEILSLDVNALTPMEALKRIDSWRRRLYPAT